MAIIWMPVWTERTAKSVFSTFRSNKRIATHEELRRYSSSAGVEKVLSVSS